MDVLALKRPRLWTYLWVCGLTLAVGWGIRDRLPGSGGAVLPGVLGALAIALVTPDPSKRSRAGHLALAGGAALGLASNLSVDPAAEMLAQPATQLRGLYLLAAKGAITGGLAGCAMGMVLSPVRYRFRDLLWLAPVFAFAAAARWLPEEPGPHADGSVTLGVAVLFVLMWLHAIKRDSWALFFAICSTTGFGIGVPLGHLLPVGEDFPAALSGLCVGVAWGFASAILDEELAGPPSSHDSSVSGIVLILAGWVPMLLVVSGRLLRPDVPQGWAAAVLLAFGLVLGVAAAVSERRPLMFGNGPFLPLVFALLLSAGFAFSMLGPPKRNFEQGIVRFHAFACVLLTAYAVARGMNLRKLIRGYPSPGALEDP